MAAFRAAEVLMPGRGGVAWAQAILQTVADGILLIDEQGIIESINPAAEHLFRYHAREVVGRDIRELMPDHHGPAAPGQEPGSPGAGYRRFTGLRRELEGRREDGSTFPIDLAVTELEIGGRRHFTNIVRDITDQKRAEYEERERAVAAERNRLSREIHDTLAQSLSVMVMRLELAGHNVISDPEATRADLESAKLLAVACVEDIRRSIWDLQPKALESTSLVDAIKKGAERLEQSGIESEFKVSGAHETPMAGRNQSAALRVVQEAVSNVINHSRAKTAVVSLYFGPVCLLITVADDGIGFDQGAVQGISPSGGSFGLASMRERARLTGGSVEVQSAPGQGTTVEIRIPYDPA